MCRNSISPLYPAIEIITALALTALYMYVPLHYFFAYSLFFSALIVTIRSDLETMLISSYVTLFLIPAGIALSAFDLLPICVCDSISGTLLGYFTLFITRKIFYWCTKKEGIGLGDVELLACIGAFNGFLGCWISLLLGSVFGSLVGIAYLYFTPANRNTRIPFGPFLAGGAMLYVLFQNQITPWFIYVV